MTVELHVESGGERIEARRFVRFVALGGCAAAVNWLSRFPLGLVLPFSMAVVAAYLVGMAVAFVLFSRYVFPSSPRPLAEQAKFFVAVNVAGVAQVWLVSIALARHLFPMIGFVGPFAEPVAHGLAIGVPTISSYFGHRFLTFRS
jgi:energy-coupling factor transport system substrate-specific component